MKEKSIDFAENQYSEDVGYLLVAVQGSHEIVMVGLCNISVD